MSKFIDSERNFTTNDWESASIAEILQHARELWPGIKDEEILISGSGNSRYTGDDANYCNNVEPSAEWIKRINNG